MVNTRKNSHVEYLDQVISLSPRDGVVERAPGPAIWFFQDHQWKQRHDPSFKPQASSAKSQAPIFRKQAASLKRQALKASSDKPQATSSKLQASSLK